MASFGIAFGLLALALFVACVVSSRIVARLPPPAEGRDGAARAKGGAALQP